MLKFLNLIKAVNRRIRGILRKITFKICYGRRVKISGVPILENNMNVAFSGGGTLSVGKHLSLRRNVEFWCSGNITIGNNVFFNNNCSITAKDEIIIGDNCLFGENVKIYDHNHAFNDKVHLIRTQGFTHGRVVIGNNVWCGSNVTILKGVSIGDNCVIGAGCVIYSNIPANCIVKNKQNLNIQKIVYSN